MVSRVAAYPPWKKEHSRMQGLYQGAKLYNLLPSHIREEERLSAFKRLIKEVQ